MGLRRIPFALSILISVTGCGTLFNQQRSDTATAAQQKFTGAKLADLLKEERKHNGEILTREIDTAQRQLTAARDARLIAIVVAGDPKAALEKAARDRYKELTGDDKEIVNLLIDIEEREAGFRVSQDRYVVRRRRDDPKPGCSGSGANVSARAKGDWEDLQIRCTELAEFRDKLATHTKAGKLGDTALRIAATERARIELAAQLKTAEAEARKTAEALAGAQAAGKVVLDRKQLDDLKKQVENVTIPSQQQLSSAGIDDVRAAAALRWVEMQKSAIDKILAAATSGATEPPPGTKNELQIAAVLPSVSAQLQEGFRYPRVSALVMESNRLRIETDRYRRQLARVDEELELLRARLSRLRGETSTVSDAIANRDAQDVALAKYAEAWTVWRIPAVATDWKLIALSHDRALDQSEAALAQWEALVRTPLETLVASAGSGLKPDEIARLLHSVELGAIALGVY